MPETLFSSNVNIFKYLRSDYFHILLLDEYFQLLWYNSLFYRSVFQIIIRYTHI